MRLLVLGLLVAALTLAVPAVTGLAMPAVALAAEPIPPLSEAPVANDPPDTVAAPVEDPVVARTTTAYGGAIVLGPFPGERDQPIVAMAATATGAGFWVAGPDGSVSARGDASLYGSAVDLSLTDEIVDIMATPTGQGYWLVAADGGVFSFGDAAFFGSTGAMSLNQPIVGAAASPSGRGYWLVASDGGIFAFGDAPFWGSTGSMTLLAPIVEMARTASGRGYWLAASDGGVFTFGDAPFLGSEGKSGTDKAVSAIAPSPDGLGYWLSTLDGQVLAYGVAEGGSAAETVAFWPSAPTIDIEASPTGGYWLVHGDPIEFSHRDQGTAVVTLQTALNAIGYWPGPVDGVFGSLTEQAVYAFQSMQGLALTGEADAVTLAALSTAERPHPASASGDVVEVDKSRQVVFVVRNGEVLWTFHTSTGTEGPYVYAGTTYVADTPPGRYVMERQIDGLRVSHLGRLYRPKYVVGGIAIHGAGYVPPYAASHGCIRLTNAAMDLIWNDGLLPLGTSVWVYGTSPST